MKIKEVNIGEIIQKIVEEKYSSYAEFGRNICKSRQNIKNQIFSKKSLHSDQLINISNELGVNLFKYFINEDDTSEKETSTEKIKISFHVEIRKEDLDRIKVVDLLKNVKQ